MIDEIISTGNKKKSQSLIDMFVLEHKKEEFNRVRHKWLPTNHDGLTMEYESRTAGLFKLDGLFTDFAGVSAKCYRGIGLKTKMALKGVQKEPE